MKYRFVFIAALMASLTAQAEPVQHRLIVNGFSLGKAFIVAADKTIEKEVPDLEWVQDSWLLANGNYLFSYKTGVKELATDLSVVWEYKSPADVELHSVQPLENGHVLAAECGTKRLIEVDRTGTIVNTIKLTTKYPRHLQVRTVRKTEQGTYWVAFLGESKIKEIDADGTVLREWKTGKVKKQAHGLQILANGHILASTAYAGSVKEFDADGQVVWELTPQDLVAAGVTKTGYTGMVQRLPNGNTMVSMYHGEPQLFEVTPDKKIVWTLYNEAFGNVAGFRVLD
jgi:streptogramin lyase